MIPTLYAPNAQNTENDGKGTLADAITCYVEEELNGRFECEFTYPVGGRIYDEIQVGSLIKAKPNDIANNQIFRIYKVARPINQVVTVYAEHISYELNANPVLGWGTSGNAAAILNNLLESALLPHRYTAVSDISTGGEVGFPGPQTVRGCMGGQSGSILDVFGGEYEWDNHTVYLHAHRGQNRGVSIEYGKNLVDLTQEESIDSTYTHVLPYAKQTADGTDKYYYMSGNRTVAAPNAEKFACKRVLMVDFSDKFQAQGDKPALEPTEEVLAQLAENYITSNNVGVPHVSFTVKPALLPEYRDNPALGRVLLGDTVTVRFPALGVEATAKVISAKYNVLTDQVEEIQLGDAKSIFADSYNATVQEVEKIPVQTQSMLQAAVDNATKLLTGAKGGCIVTMMDADGHPSESLYMDTPDVATAKKVLRINYNGVGGSDTGVNGPYNVAMTLDGSMNATQITTGILNADLIRTGVIRATGNPDVYFDVTNGVLASTKLISTKWNEKTYELFLGTERNNSGEMKMGLVMSENGAKKLQIYPNAFGGIDIDLCSGHTLRSWSDFFAIDAGEKTLAMFYLDKIEFKIPVYVEGRKI